MDEEEEKTSEDIGINSEKSQNRGQQVTQKASQAKDRVKQVADIAKKISKKANSGAAKVGKAVAKIASKLGPALPYVALAAVIIFVIIGICGFLATMPGLLAGKLKDISQAVADWWQKKYKSDSDALVNKKQVIETAEYLRSMGYDLIGYGFIPAREITLAEVKGEDFLAGIDEGSSVLEEDGKYTIKASNGEKAGYYYDKYGICYKADGTEEGTKDTFETAGTITGYLKEDKSDPKNNIPDTSRIRTYLLADRRVFLIRNYDDDNWILNAWHDLFNQNDEDWAKGLISLYHAQDYIATGEYKEIEAGYIKVDHNTKEMDVKVGWNSNSMKFKMDGWSGRYGLSLEFLLSLHLGTMAPELVTTMARTFDTEVQVYLDRVKQKITGYYKDENSKYITAQMIEDADGFHIGNKDAFDILHNPDFNLKSQEDGKFACTNVPTTTVWASNTDRDVDEPYSKIIQSQHASKEADTFKFEGDNPIEGKDWHDFLWNSEYAYVNYESDYETGCDDWSNNIEAIAYNVNMILNEINENSENNIFNGNKSKGTGGFDNYWVEGAIDKSGNEIEGQVTWKQVKDKWGYTDSGQPKAYKFWRESAKDSGAKVNAPDGLTVVGKDTGWKHFEWLMDKWVPFNEFKQLKKGENEEWPILSLNSYPQSNPDYSQQNVRWQLSIIMYRTEGDSNIDVGVIFYKIPSVASRTNPITCSELPVNGDTTHACENCEKYLETIRDALYAITNDGSDMSGELDTYNPYIARVIDSWFRDTYFVVPGDWAGDGEAPNESLRDEDWAIMNAYMDLGKNTDYGIGTEEYPGNTKLTGNSIDFVDVDNEYLEDTDEYWSKYETTTNSQGEMVYVLYELKNNGTLNTSNKYIKDIDSEGREVYKNIDTGDTELVEESDLKLVKKHESSGNITDGWNDKTVKDDDNVYGKVWTVYSNVTKEGWSDYYELEIHAKTNKNIREIAKFTSDDNYEKYFYYRYQDRKVIEQEEDARRGITNPTIKQMFKIRKYYIYDGTEEKAKAIYEDWQKVIANYGSTCLTNYESDPKFIEKYSESSHNIERAVEMAIDDFYYNNDHSIFGTKDPRNKNLIGNITINKDTLNAFSILENTHTLDADYQYRDFKELIVELDYFDKEDLSDKPEEIFEWIIPEYSEKWPLRLIDKSDEYYGTLVHSDLAVTQLKTDLGITDPAADPAADPDAEETDPNKTEIASATGYAEGLDIIAPVTGQVINYGKYKRDNTDFIQSKGEEETAKTLEDQGVNVEEEVGFIQIKVLDKTSVELIKNACGGAKISVEYEDEDGDKQTDNNFNEADAWNGYYEEYEGVCEGYVITIEGIELLDGNDSVDDLIANVSSLSAVEMQPKTTPNLVDNSEEIENQKIENAKVLLPAAKVVDGKLYIREGTKIGKTTYSTTTEFKNYSYIRMILRDAKLRLIENVEDYFDLPNESSLGRFESIEALISKLGVDVTLDSTYDKAMTYWDSVQKYSAMYGLDPYLVIAMICQESSADPGSDGAAYGLMQWEKSNGSTLTVTKADGSTETITNILDNLEGDPDFQIKVGCAELKTKVDEYNGNVAVALQAYNYGSGGVKHCIRHYLKRKTGTATAEQLEEYMASGDLGWLEDREWYSTEGWKEMEPPAGPGDPNYIEHVLDHYNTGGA